MCEFLNLFYCFTTLLEYFKARLAYLQVFNFAVLEISAKKPDCPSSGPKRNTRHD